ncbi:MAG: NAD-dependent epimerase/dehydratase family protein [Candidatus Eisenbacteria sp.]|nr:NAD-dependent epimerase/dehydratase family protein [Candidatus Eisenbacteria bacterium]
MSRLVLVTGATGFAGSSVMEALLAAGYQVRIPVRPVSNRRWLPATGIDLVPADLRDPDSLRELVRDVSWVFHFGGVTRVPTREGYFQVNTEGTIQLYRIAAEQDQFELFLFCSSLAASGPAPSADRPRTEEDPPAPRTPYGESKLAAERWLLDQSRPGRRLVIVRPPAIYGPRDVALLELMTWARRGWLPLPAPRGSLVSIIHARDLAAACLLLAEREAAGIFHASDGGFYSWESVGELLGDYFGRPLRRVRIPSAAIRLAGWWGELVGKLTGRQPVINRDKVEDILQPYWICSVDKLRGVGFEPRVGVADGMRETLEWYRQEGWL